MRAGYTIKKKITDMSIYFTDGRSMWDGSIVITSPSSTTVHGKYFDTKAEAETYAETLYQEAK